MTQEIFTTTFTTVCILGEGHQDMHFLKHQHGSDNYHLRVQMWHLSETRMFELCQAGLGTVPGDGDYTHGTDSVTLMIQKISLEQFMANWTIFYLNRRTKIFIHPLSRSV